MFRSYDHLQAEIYLLEITLFGETKWEAALLIALKVRGVFRLRNVTITGFYYLLLNCYTFRSYDHLQAEIYFLEITLLTTDPLFLEY
jgi:hypothetical protein